MINKLVSNLKSISDTCHKNIKELGVSLGYDAQGTEDDIDKELLYIINMLDKSRNRLLWVYNERYATRHNLKRVNKI